MGDDVIDGVIVTPQKIVSVPGGDILHGIKSSDPGYAGFGETYFSMVEHQIVKGWKRHRIMTLNLLVPVGEIRFVIFDDRAESPSCGIFQELTISRSNYCRLTVPPMVWMGFQGVSNETAILLNVADIPHDPQEAERKDLPEIEFNWSLNR